MIVYICETPKEKRIELMNKIEDELDLRFDDSMKSNLVDYSESLLKRMAVNNGIISTLKYLNDFMSREEHVDIDFSWLDLPWILSKYIEKYHYDEVREFMKGTIHPTLDGVDIQIALHDYDDKLIYLTPSEAVDKVNSLLFETGTVEEYELKDKINGLIEKEGVDSLVKRLDECLLTFKTDHYRWFEIGKVLMLLMDELNLELKLQPKHDELFMLNLLKEIDNPKHHSLTAAYQGEAFVFKRGIKMTKFMAIQGDTQTKVELLERLEVIDIVSSIVPNECSSEQTLAEMLRAAKEKIGSEELLSLIKANGKLHTLYDQHDWFRKVCDKVVS